MQAAPLAPLDRTPGVQPNVGAAAGPVVKGAPAAAAPADPQAAATPSALDLALQSAAALQGGLNALFADLTAALQAAALPPETAAAAQSLLDAELQLDPPPSAQDLKAAVAASGLFYEAGLADAAAPVAGDLKGLLLQLRDALPAAGATPAGEAPAPPYRQGPQTAQPALPEMMAAMVDPHAVVARLARRTTAALARQVLMQAASAGVGRPGAERTADRTWLFELPLSTPEGTAVAQFEVEADKEEAGPGARRTWRTRFTFDVAPIGPVHARISHTAGQTRVALWVEDAATLARLSARRAELDAMLGEADLPSQVAILPGAPATPSPPPAGHFMAVRA